MITQIVTRAVPRPIFMFDTKNDEIAEKIMHDWNSQTIMDSREPRHISEYFDVTEPMYMPITELQQFIDLQNALGEELQVISVFQKHFWHKKAEKQQFFPKADGDSFLGKLAVPIVENPDQFTRFVLPVTVKATASEPSPNEADSLKYMLKTAYQRMRRSSIDDRILALEEEIKKPWKGIPGIETFELHQDFPEVQEIWTALRENEHEEDRYSKT